MLFQSVFWSQHPLQCCSMCVCLLFPSRAFTPPTCVAHLATSVRLACSLRAVVMFPAGDTLPAAVTFLKGSGVILERSAVAFQKWICQHCCVIETRSLLWWREQGSPHFGFVPFRSVVYVDFSVL